MGAFFSGFWLLFSVTAVMRFVVPEFCRIKVKVENGARRSKWESVYIPKKRSLRILFIDCGHECVLSNMIASHIDHVCCTSHTAWKPTFPISLNM